jgi:hypothetical protein
VGCVSWALPDVDPDDADALDDVVLLSLLWALHPATRSAAIAAIKVTRE